MDVSRQLDEVIALLDVAVTPWLREFFTWRKAWLERIIFDTTRPEPTPRPDSQTWDRLRRKRLQIDKYTCQGCGAEATKQNVHHIVPLHSGGSNEIKNLITLCDRCHRQIHPWLDEEV